MMNYTKLNDDNNQTCGYLSSFIPEDGVEEYQVILELTDGTLTYKEQINRLHKVFDNLRKGKLKNALPVITRYFLSDAANQLEELQDSINPQLTGAISIIEQPPLNGTKIALWAYLQTDMDIQLLDDGLWKATHSAFGHLWKGSATNRGGDSEIQTKQLLNDYILNLNAQHCLLADNCIRTWFYVQNIDVNYSGLVKARNEIFHAHELTDKTHFIASTGIGGRNADPKTVVQMDAYAVQGISAKQIQYLYAKTHLSSTAAYGVRFERGTCVKYGDRRHVFISGTASIDYKGEVLWVGDIRKQTLRVWGNVNALLNEADCSMDDVAYATVYLRDVADYNIVKEMYDSHFPKLPIVIVLAPVCRSHWLIEMECMAIRADKNNQFDKF